MLPNHGTFRTIANQILDALHLRAAEMSKRIIALQDPSPDQKQKWRLSIHLVLLQVRGQGHTDVNSSERGP